MSQAHRIKQIIKNLTHQKQKLLFEFILIQFFKTCLLVKTNFYLFQMSVFFTFLSTKIWWGGIQSSISACPWLLRLQICCLGKCLSVYGLTNFMLKLIWCGSEVNYDDVFGIFK